jgi:hypothetical protein
MLIGCGFLRSPAFIELEQVFKTIHKILTFANAAYCDNASGPGPELGKSAATL